MFWDIRLSAWIILLRGYGMLALRADKNVESDLEPAEFLVDLCKKIPSHVNEECGSGGFFYSDGRLAAEVHALLAIDHEAGGFGTLQAYLEGAITADEMRP